MKKFLMPLLIIVFAVQIFVPAYTIWERYDVLSTGQEIRMRVEPLDPYDAFRGRYVSLSFVDNNIMYSYNEGKYGVYETDSEGFAVLSYVTNEKPVGETYLVSQHDNYFRVPLDRYYMEENLAPKAEKALSGNAGAYVTVRVKGDKSVISGLYIDGKPAEEWLEDME